MRASWLACALYFGSSMIAGEAAAEAVEVAHEVRVDFAAEMATLTVRRSAKGTTFDNFEAHFSVRTDGPLVATGLRTRGDDGNWYVAKLLPVDQAVATYWMLTGSQKVVPEREPGPRFPQLGPRDPALMMWAPEGFEVYAFPVSDGHPRTVEYTLAAAYQYMDGGYAVRVPIGAADELAPVVTIGAVAAGYTVMQGETAVAAGTKLRELPTTRGERHDSLELRLVPTTSRPLVVRLASTPAGGRHLTRAEVEVGTLLGPDPARTHAVIVLDRSRSLLPEHHDAARRAALAYLAALGQVAGSRAEVVLFDRVVESRFGKFVAPGEAAGALQAPAKLANGSELAGALAAAHTLLKTAPRGAPRRVLVLSDTVVDPEREPAVHAALAAMRTDGVVAHVADITANRWASLDSDGGHRLGGPVRETGGEVWFGHYDVEYGKDVERFAEWVRPRRVRDLEITVDGIGAGDAFDLRVGEGAQEVGLRQVAPREVRARGFLWGSPIVVSARRDVRGDRAWTVLAAGYDDDTLTADEQRDIAVRAGAVSPMTALLALEPNVTPGQAQVANTARSSGRTFSCGMGIGNPHRFGRFSLQFDEEAFVRGAVAEARTQCLVPGRAVRAEVTTGYAEVVAIPAVEVEGDPVAANCVREKLWALEVPGGQHGVVRHVVELPAG